MANYLQHLDPSLIFGGPKLKDSVAPRVVSREERVQITTQSGVVLDGFAEDRGSRTAVIVLHSVLAQTCCV